MEAIKQAATSVSETIQGATAGTSKEANKHIAKDGNNDVSTRLTAAKDAVGDKISQESHNTHADVAQKKSNIL